MNTLAIVGGGVTMMDCPFDDPTYTIWTTPSVCKALPRVDVLFEFHSGDAIQEDWIYKKAHDVIYKDAFPIQELVNVFGEIFNSSMAMILAYAYHKGYRKIELYGIDNALEDEYAKYRANLMYLIGYLRGNGAEITLSKGSLLMPPCKRYGYEKDYAALKLEAIERDLKRKEHEAEYLRGALDSARFFSKL